MVYTEALGPAAFIGRARVVPLRNMGAALSPFNAFLILQGIETLAAAHGPHLRQHAGAGPVPAKPPQGGMGAAMPACPTTPTTPLAQRQMGGRASGILSFGLKAGDADGAQPVRASWMRCNCSHAW